MIILIIWWFSFLINIFILDYEYDSIDKGLKLNKFTWGEIILFSPLFIILYILILFLVFVSLLLIKIL